MSTPQQATTKETRCLECDAPIRRAPGKPGRAPLRCPLHRVARKRKIDQRSRRDAAIRRATRTPLPDEVPCAECGKPIHWNRSKGGRPPERCPPCRAERRTSLKRLYKRGEKAPGPGYVARIDRPVPAAKASGETGTVRTGHCVDCGATVSVTGRGGLPKRCAEHRAEHNAKLGRERKAKAAAKKPKPKPKPSPKASKRPPTPPKAKERPGPTVSAKPVQAKRSASKARRPAAKPAPGRATTPAAIRPRTRQPAPREETRTRNATTNGAEAKAQPVTRTPIAKPPPKPKPWQRRVRQINAELGTSMSAAEMIELGLKPFEDEWWG